MKFLRSQQGAASALLPIVVLSLLFIASLAFAIWAFGSRQDYKDNVDAKVNAAVADNTKTVQAKDAASAAEAAKSPLKTYVGPDAYGSVHLLYPKTWSALINTGSDSDTPIDAYFHNDYLSSTDDSSTVFNLRLQVVNNSYDSELGNYSDQVSQHEATATPYALPKVPNVIGTRLDGQLFDNNAKGSLVLIPLRDKTLEVWTNDQSNVNDFNTYILPNLSFSP